MHDSARERISVRQAWIGGLEIEEASWFSFMQLCGLSMLFGPDFIYIRCKCCCFFRLFSWSLNYFIEPIIRVNQYIIIIMLLVGIIDDVIPEIAFHRL